ncbi:MAG: aspartate--tRNA ligase [Clostridia bacterium]|nr:aspartate--tRNA ligase [Clostridia bacterium]
MNFLKRTIYCGDLRVSDIGKKVTVCGWVQRQRDLGQLIFIDLRDRTGIVQLSFNEKTSRDIFDKAFHIRAEFVLCASGTVVERSSKNMEIPTGEIEIDVDTLQILSESQTPPFEILNDSNVNEELRLKYRYLDLRRPDMQNKIILRHKIVKAARDYFDDNGFIEVETPILIKSTPEGARDYLVPSRVFPGEFFALPQSPQMYKQLTMLAGFDRYMQIAKCFRDEDLRADRQPEFTQIDLEMSFADENDVMAISEGFIKKIYKDVLNIDIPLPLQRMTYSEAMERFGSDKPDLRFGMELVDVTQELKNTQFRVFASAVNSPNGAVKAIVAKNASDKFTRKAIDKLTHWIKAYGAMGLAWTKINSDGSSSSSYEKFLSQDETAALRDRVAAQNNDIIFIVSSDNKQVVYDSLGALRCELAKQLNIIDKSKPSLLWITDFPLFEYSEEEDRYVSKHHPFTMPFEEDIDLLCSHPEKTRAIAYDMILNGNEIGGGSVRISQPDIQEKMFNALGFSQQEAYDKFGYLIDAFKFGAPPHAGLAFGLDRLIMIMLDCDSIRDVIAYPKVASSAELMSKAPSAVSQKQLDELGICIKSEK